VHWQLQDCPWHYQKSGSIDGMGKRISMAYRGVAITSEVRLHWVLFGIYLFITAFVNSWCVTLTSSQPLLY
jgi:hypothetical protein